MKYVDLELNEFNNDLSYYDDDLSTWPQFKEIKRQINIESILDNKKIQYTITDMFVNGGTPNPLFGFWVESDPNDQINQHQHIGNSAAFVRKEMDLIIQNGKIVKLTIGIQELETHSGKIIKNLLEHYNLKLRTKSSDNNLNKLGYFYLTT